MMEEQLSLKMKHRPNSVLLYFSNLNKVSFHGFFCNARDLIRWAYDNPYKLTLDLLDSQQNEKIYPW